MKTLVTLFLLVNFLNIPVQAQDRQPDAVQIDEKKEAEIALKVKNKIYAGGKDESPLKVQPSLAKPMRKIAPTVEENHESDGDHD